MRPLATLILASLAALALSLTPAEAQSSVLFCMDGNEVTLDNGGGLLEAGLLREDEVGIVTPGGALGTYSASTFLGVSNQWAFLGDVDLDGRLADSSTAGPGDDTDAVFVKRFTGAPTGPVGLRDVYVSKESDTAGHAAGFEDSNVYRHSAQGVVEIFLSEILLENAFNSAASNDLNAICQSDTGDLFLSVSDASPAVGTDGSILHIPASAITYDAGGNVIAIVAGSLVEIATETDMFAMVTASGMATSVGGAPSSSSFDISALEIDPAGGTWTSPVDAMVYPNLLFAWQGFSNDGAILSTALGGSFATINGVDMASMIATTGVQVGLLPDSSGLGGMMGLAVVDEIDAPLVMENDPVNLITTSTLLWTRQEVSGATPGGSVVFFVDFGPTPTGSFLPSSMLSGLTGEFFGMFPVVMLGNSPADARGYASVSNNIPVNLQGSGINLVWQAVDGTTLTLSAPAAMQFL